MKPLAFMLLAANLTACVDANLDVKLTGEGTASATLVQEMRQDSYTMLGLVDGLDAAAWQAGIKAIADAEKWREEAEAKGEDPSEIVVPPQPADLQFFADRFCVNGRMLVRVDGGATCMDSSEGAYADIALGDLSQPLTFTPEGDGLVRIELPTSQLLEAVTTQAELTQEQADIVPALFGGRRIVITFSGAEVTESNMTIDKAGKVARQDIAILDLLSGKADLPDTFYAVVREP